MCVSSFRLLSLFLLVAAGVGVACDLLDDQGVGPAPILPGGDLVGDLLHLQHALMFLSASSLSLPLDCRQPVQADHLLDHLHIPVADHYMALLDCSGPVH